MAQILIVDDEPTTLKLLKLNLELDGHEAFLASDGETALKRIEAERPDLVLLDVMMPVFDGWEVLKRLGEMKLNKGPKIIIMTAKVSERDLAKGLELGAHEYVTKPFDLDEFMGMIREILELSMEDTEQRRQAHLQGLGQ